MDIAQAQARVDAWVQRTGVGYFSPLSNLARLTEEVGELARDLNHRFGDKPPKPGEDPGDPAMELADIVFVVIAIANSLEIDLDTALERVFAKIETRDKARFGIKDD